MEGLSCSQQQAIGLFNRTHLLKIFEYDSQEDWAVFEETEDHAAEEMQ